jgi:hypothetical protein
VLASVKLIYLVGAAGHRVVHHRLLADHGRRRLASLPLIWPEKTPLLRINCWLRRTAAAPPRLCPAMPSDGGRGGEIKRGGGLKMTSGESPHAARATARGSWERLGRWRGYVPKISAYTSSPPYLFFLTNPQSPLILHDFCMCLNMVSEHDGSCLFSRVNSTSGYWTCNACALKSLNLQNRLTGHQTCILGALMVTNRSTYGFLPKLVSQEACTYIFFYIWAQYASLHMGPTCYWWKHELKFYSADGRSKSEPVAQA